MQTCPHCGRDNADDARFCSSCGALLAPPESREERKVVSVLFADLVGFTARAEAMDPEDVRAVLAPYHSHLRAELERRGGTVEKFIGDAVMALFGAPVAHEDDSERAVRAALAIRDWIGEQGELELRVAVTTGEALIDLGARPSEGEGMASGDVVNTAARLQAAAPVNGILVDEATYRATEHVIVYEEREPVAAKGKTDPISVWEAIEARSRFGVDIAQRSRAQLIGRERELDVLVAALARVREERSLQLVTLVGVPGIGKSRLTYELFQTLEADPEFIYWRQGRSLPYGEGVSFWALSEMVKAHAGILETDSPEETEAKLSRMSADLLEGKDAEWVRGHLRPLVGLSGEEELRVGRAEEAFPAWRRFFESLAEDRPLVLVFEDLHWADESLLDFVDHLVDWAGEVPILVVCTARPELLTRRSAWGGGKPNAATVSLSPLSDEQTAQLLAELLERSVLPAETQSALLQRAGGNPLYAEEFARMVADRGVASEDELPLPESVQGIVAARLDALDAQEKALLQDVAVMGKVFWLGSAAQIGGVETTTAHELLHGLERKEFVRRARRSSVAEETEYAFRHLLVRDVAYGQIPRAQRGEKHRLAAEWIEALGRPEDHAEMLAHHYMTALELARATGADTSGLIEPARLALREAGERALALGAYPAATQFYRAALELWPSEDPDRPILLLSYGRIVAQTEIGFGLDVLTQARDGLLAAGDREKAAEAEMVLGEALWRRGQRDSAFEHFSQAEALVQDASLSSSRAYVIGGLSRFLMLAGETEDAIRLGREALEMATALGLEELRASALTNIGSARGMSGDTGGLADLEQSIAISRELNSPESARAHSNLASVLVNLGEVDRSIAMQAQALRLVDRLGLGPLGRKLRAERVWELYVHGRWDEGLALAEELIPGFEANPYIFEGPLRCDRGSMRLAFGDVEGAQADALRAVELAPVGTDPQLVLPALAFAARAFCSTDPRRASGFVGELFDEVARSRELPGTWLADLAIALVTLDKTDELGGGERFHTSTPWLEAAIAMCSGEFRRAADIYARMGIKPQEADARLRAAQALVREGARAQAEIELQQALAFWRSVNATAYVREGEALLAASA